MALQYRRRVVVPYGYDPSPLRLQMYAQQLTQRALAREIGASEVTVMRALRPMTEGRPRPNMEVTLWLCWRLGVDPFCVFHYDRERLPAHSVERISLPISRQ